MSKNKSLLSTLSCGELILAAESLVRLITWSMCLLTTLPSSSNMWYVTVPSFFEMVPGSHVFPAGRSFTYTVSPSLNHVAGSVGHDDLSVAHVFL